MATIRGAQALSEMEITEESLYLCGFLEFCGWKTTCVYDLTITSSRSDDEEDPAPRYSRGVDKTRTSKSNIQSRSQYKARFMQQNRMGTMRGY